MIMHGREQASGGSSSSSSCCPPPSLASSGSSWLPSKRMLQRSAINHLRRSPTACPTQAVQLTRNNNPWFQGGGHGKLDQKSAKAGSSAAWGSPSWPRMISRSPRLTSRPWPPIRTCSTLSVVDMKMMSSSHKQNWDIDDGMLLQRD